MSSNDYDLSYNIQSVDFFYVYHFKCKMHTGLNIIKHTYRQEMSNSVAEEYSFDYVLTAANRWKGGVIRDFELILNLGSQQRFSLKKSFFKSGEDWAVKGNGLILKEDIIDYCESNWMTVLLDSGNVIFRKTDFEPNGELHFANIRNWASPLRFDASSWALSNDFQVTRLYPGPKDAFSKKVLKNYPFALRGYVFQNKNLQAYFEKQDWYRATPSYLANLTDLPLDEQLWVNTWSK